MNANIALIMIYPHGRDKTSAESAPGCSAG